MKLKNKVAVITGAGRGIGRHIALGFAKEGAKLIIVSRTESEIIKTAKAIKKIGVDVLPSKTDVSNEKDVLELVRKIKKKFTTVDILVNNAGILGPIGLITDIKTEEWIKTIKINLIGTFICTKYLLPFMIEKKSGKIVNLSGGGAAYPKPFFGAYASSKAAVIRFTENLAEELKDYNIQVNAIAPGGVKTKMQMSLLHQKGVPKSVVEEVKEIMRTGGTPPQKIISLALFLATDDSNGLTGKLIHVNDPWEKWSKTYIEKLLSTDLYSLKRINPT